MSVLVNLQNLVDSGKIALFNLFYPNVSPIVKLEWIGSYDSKIDMEQIFAKPALNIQNACENLYHQIGIHERALSIQDRLSKEKDILDAEIYLINIKDFIDERVDFYGDESWLLALEYNLENGLADKWCMTLEGSQLIDMPIIKCGTTLKDVCLEVWDLIEKFPIQK